MVQDIMEATGKEFVREEKCFLELCCFELINDYFNIYCRNRGGYGPIPGQVKSPPPIYQGQPFGERRATQGSQCYQGGPPANQFNQLYHPPPMNQPAGRYQVMLMCILDATLPLHASGYSYSYQTLM